MQDIEEFDNLKTKVLKYVLYKKRTEAEVRQKFLGYTGEMLEDVIKYLKENDYINDKRYISKIINEFENLNNMSIKEIQYKLLAKGLSKSNIEDYISDNLDDLTQYELKSAKAIFLKKQTTMDNEEICAYLRKKGYMDETIRSLQNE